MSTAPPLDADRLATTGIDGDPTHRTVAVSASRLEELQRCETLASLHGQHVQLLQTQVSALDAELKAARASDERHAEALMHIARTCDNRADEMQAQHAAALRGKDDALAQVIRSKDEIVALFTQQLADKDKQLPALLQVAVGDIRAEVIALRVTLADKEKAVGDMEAELRTRRTKLAECEAAVAARDALVSEKQAQVAALAATVAERDRTIEALRRAAPAPGPVAGSIVTADNFCAEARVRYSFSGANFGVLLSIAGDRVKVRWGTGKIDEIRIPYANLLYA
jgi:septal ring factor EnvC (AmiA/AmiB activator)